jgi:hypothetical protein
LPIYPNPTPVPSGDESSIRSMKNKMRNSILSCLFRSFLALPILLAVVVSGPVSAQEPDSTRIAELERRLDAITRELERMELGGDVVQADSSVGGFGLGASKVYRIQQGVSIGGYGEVLYENYSSEAESGAASSKTDQFDALRGILYVGYKFNDRLLFNSEIEIEHAKEAFLEFAYVDYLFTDNFGLRGGLLLAPMGLINELHEPPAYLGTERPLTENRIIPTTWRENGVGFFGRSDAFEWRAYLMNSFKGSGLKGSGIRGGRQKGGKALAEDLGVTGRLDYVGTPGLILGASAYSGQTAQNQELNGGEVDGRVFIWDLHADYKFRGWDLRALVAGARVGDVEEMNELNGLSGDDGIGEEMLGWYVQAGYDVLRQTTTTHQLIPYLRFERLDTQREVAAGFSADPGNDMTVTSLGVAWKPDPQVVWKLDYQIHSNEAETGLNQWNVQIGWLF